jgi:putative SOS response-associated peptidase YedK
MELLAELGLALTDVPADWVPRFNIAPSQDVPVVIDGEPGKVSFVRWGLIPSWAKDEKIGHGMINARGDTAPDKPAFRDAWRRRHCVVLADGFYEWQRSGRTKVPYYFQLKSGGPLAFAGLWERWRSPVGWVRSCAILTTDANALVGPIHDRMPVILAPGDVVRWLDRELPEDARRSLLAPLGADALTCRAVSPIVNSPAVDGPECVAPAEPAQPRLFD